MKPAAANDLSNELKSIKGHIQAGDIDIAYQQCQALYEQHTTNNELLYLFTVSCRYRQEFEQACDLCKQLLDYHPEFGRGHQEYGHILLQTGHRCLQLGQGMCQLT